MLIDYKLLSEEIVRELCITYINTEVGNDVDNTSLDSKVEKALTALEKGELLVLFSQMYEEAHLIPKEDFNSNRIG